MNELIGLKMLAEIFELNILNNNMGIHLSEKYNLIENTPEEVVNNIKNIVNDKVDISNDYILGFRDCLRMMTHEIFEVCYNNKGGVKLLKEVFEIMQEKISKI